MDVLANKALLEKELNEQRRKRRGNNEERKIEVKVSDIKEKFLSLPHIASAFNAMEGIDTNANK